MEGEAQACPQDAILSDPMGAHWETLGKWLSGVMRRIIDERREPGLEGAIRDSGLTADELVKKLKAVVESSQSVRGQDDSSPSARAARIHTVLVEEIGRWEEQIRVCAARKSRVAD